MTMNNTIQFTVNSEQRREIEAYAVEKGFKGASGLALHAVVQLMRRYPLTRKERVRLGLPVSGDGKNPEGVQTVHPVPSTAQK